MNNNKELLDLADWYCHQSCPPMVEYSHHHILLPNLFVNTDGKYGAQELKRIIQTTEISKSTDYLPQIYWPTFDVFYAVTATAIIVFQKLEMFLQNS